MVVITNSIGNHIIMWSGQETHNETDFAIQWLMVRHMTSGFTGKEPSIEHCRNERKMRMGRGNNT